jgi:penicillin-binding protein 1C
MRRLSHIKWLVLGGLSALFVLNIAFPPPLQRAYDNSVVVTDKDHQWLSAFSVEQGRWRIKADLEAIDPRFIDRLIEIEDQRFFHHSGVDGLAIVRATRSWVRHGKPVSGASTITMQLVKQLEPRPRTLSSKMVETLRAIQIEARLSKREILELYLTHTPYGGNIEGVTAASLAYFDKLPDQLTDAEIALLIALPQAPEARRPDKNPMAAQRARDRILDKLVAADRLSEALADEAKETVIASRKNDFPTTAWLTADRLKSRAEKTNTHVTSSLDKILQKDAEALADKSTQSLEFNVSILVVENETMKVRAHVGSAGRDRPGGWIDMTRRSRSPGSTLKPFIYGFAFDDGLSAPGSHIFDAPTRFGSYQPENFNRRYHGDVRIYEALGHSLNVPAVLALDQVGTNRFEAALELSGLNVKRPVRENGKTGLALALGGAGLRAEDLAVLYASLANGGEAQELVWQENKLPKKSYQLMRPESAAKITKILRQAPTPAGRVPHWLTQNSHGIAYKTGTSYGFRDAWAAGFTDQWTVIVWAGRPDGAPRVGETGRKAAAPLLFDVFSLLPDPDGHKDFTRIADAPRGLTTFGGKFDKSPQILFPPDGAEIAVSNLGPDARGLTLSARSPSGDKLNYYVDGHPISRSETSGQAIWHPETHGYFKVTAVDPSGKSASSLVRVMSMQ